MLLSLAESLYVHIDYGISWYFMGINGKIRKRMKKIVFVHKSLKD
jgi:hypothetical protein